MIRAVLYDLGDVFFEAHLWRMWNYKQFIKAGVFQGSFYDFYAMYEECLLKVYNGEDNYDNALDNFLYQFPLSNHEKFLINQ